MYEVRGGNLLTISLFPMPTFNLAHFHVATLVVVTGKGSPTILPYRSATPAMVISRIEPSSDMLENPLFMVNTAPYFVLQHEPSKYHDLTPVNLRAKTTHSTTLANKTHKNPALQRIPAQFQKYQSVFSEQVSNISHNTNLGTTPST